MSLHILLHAVSMTIFITGVTTTEYELDMTTEAAAEEPAENATEAAFVTGFGSAKFFMPVPDSGDVVAAHCAWQYRTDEVPNRIPRVITEVMCINMDQSCGNSRYFKCRQVKTKLQVTYGLRATEEGIVLDGELSVRNLTVNIGCSCSYFVPIMFQAHLQAMFDEGNTWTAATTALL